MTTSAECQALQANEIALISSACTPPNESPSAELVTQYACSNVCFDKLGEFVNPRSIQNYATVCNQTLAQKEAHSKELADLQAQKSEQCGVILDADFQPVTFRAVSDKEAASLQSQTTVANSAFEKKIGASLMFLVLLLL